MCNLIDIISYTKVGLLEFGMSMTKVHELLGDNFEQFHRGEGPLPTDHYVSLGQLISYDKDDRVEFIELVSPAYPSFKNAKLLHRPLEEVTNELAAMGYRAEKDDSGFDYPEIGFGLYVPHEKIEAISVYRQGYYD